VTKEVKAMDTAAIAAFQERGEVLVAGHMLGAADIEVGPWPRPGGPPVWPLGPARAGPGAALPLTLTRPSRSSMCLLVLPALWPAAWRLGGSVHLLAQVVPLCTVAQW